MEICLARHAGFCFGVKRAVDAVEEQIQKGGRIYTYGPIVHNDEVVRDLEERGVKVIEDETELEALLDGVSQKAVAEEVYVVIRAHGVPERICERIENSGVHVIDATCPFVKRIHRIASESSAEGKEIIIVGNPGHPEVEGIRGWCKGRSFVISTPEEALSFSDFIGRDAVIVSQTTFNYKKFEHIVEILGERGYNGIVVNTICNATEERQAEASKIAQNADAMLVIGGSHSSNTRKLFEICREHCEYTYFIQTLDDLRLELPETVRVMGITAGASTPNKIIEEVQNYVRINF